MATCSWRQLAQASGGPHSLGAGVTLVTVGLAALTLGIVHATDFRGAVTRRYAEQRSHMTRLPQVLRRLTPPPTTPRGQRAAGAFLALAGCLFTIGGIHSLAP